MKDVPRPCRVGRGHPDPLRMDDIPAVKPHGAVGPQGRGRGARRETAVDFPDSLGGRRAGEKRFDEKKGWRGASLRRKK